MNEEQVRAIIRDEISRQQIRYFNRHIKLEDGVDISATGINGSRIGTSPLEKWAFFGAQPIVRPAALTLPTGGVTVDAQSRTAITDINTRLQAIGLFS